MGSSTALNGIKYAGDQIAYKDSTYELVSKVAFLHGSMFMSSFQKKKTPELFEISALSERPLNAITEK